MFRATQGLLDELGPERVLDTPLAESAIVGVAIGASLNGFLPIAEIQFADFIYGAFDQIVSEGATVEIVAVLAIIEESEVPAGTAAPAPALSAETESPLSPPAPTRAGVSPTAARRRATPRVQRLARDQGVDLGAVSGSGPGGRITERDVMAAAGAEASAPATAPSVIEQEEETLPPSAIRRTIAQRMAQSAATAPHTWLVMECDVDGLVRLRESRREEFRQRYGIDLTYLSFVARAVVEALTERPLLKLFLGRGQDSRQEAHPPRHRCVHRAGAHGARHP